jgi:carboxyl-terminal processing protease
LADLENFNITTSTVNFDSYWQIYNTLKKDYFQTDKIDTTKLFYGSLQGLVEAIDDPYTQFFTPQGKKQFDDGLAGITEGIGAMVDIKDDKLTIITPLDGLPAAKAGLLPYDQILKVDNTDIKGFSLANAISLIRGPIDTQVKLSIYRPSNNKEFEVTITRAKVVIPNVTGKN